MSKWKDILETPPLPDQPCEYVIRVTCKGWYRPNGDEPRFAADERHPPQAKFIKWRPWTDGEKWEEGQKAVQEHRQKLKKEIIE